VIRYKTSYASITIVPGNAMGLDDLLCSNFWKLSGTSVCRRNAATLFCYNVLVVESTTEAYLKVRITW